MTIQPLDTRPSALWRQRFNAPSIVSSAIATLNPSRGIITANFDGAYQLYAWDVVTGDLRQVTQTPNGVVHGAISADGQVIYYLHDEQGDNIGHLFRVPFGGGQPEDLTPTLPAYTSFYFTECYSGRFYGFIALNQNGFQVFVVDNESGGTPHLRYETPALSVGPLLSYDGEITVVATTEQTQGDDFSLEAYDTRTGQLLHTLWDGFATSITPIGFATRPADMRFVALTDRGGLQRPLIWNTRTGERRDIPLPQLAGNVEVWDWSTDANRLLLNHHHEAHHELYVYELKTDTLTLITRLSGAFGHVAGYWLANGNIAAHWQDATHPLRLIEIDTTTGDILRDMIDIPAPTGHPWRSIQVTAPDGVPVQAWISTPDSAGPHPTIVHVHGGPSDVQMDVFSAEAQAWVDHGCAFVSVNYRGSTTFGRDFEAGIYGQVGRADLADVNAVVDQLVADGIADASALVMTGSAYGGCLSLLAVSHQPERWRAAVAVAPITDWPRMVRESETLRDYQRALFNGTPDEQPAAHRHASPINFVDQVNVPVFILVEEDNLRFPPQMVFDYVERLQQANKPVTLHTVASESRQNPAARGDQQAAIMAFVFDVLT